MELNLKNDKKNKCNYFQNIKEVINKLSENSNNLINTWSYLSKKIQNNISILDEILIDQQILESKKNELNYLSDNSNKNYKKNNINILKGLIERHNLIKLLGKRFYEKEIKLQLQLVFINWILNNKKGNIQKVINSKKISKSRNKNSHNTNKEYFIYSKYFLESNKNIFNKINQNNLKSIKQNKKQMKSHSQPKKQLNFLDLNLNISNFPFRYFCRTEKNNSLINKTIINNIQTKNKTKSQEIFFFHDIPKIKLFYKTFSYLDNKYNLYFKGMKIEKEKKKNETLGDVNKINFEIKKNNSSPQKNINRYN